MTTFKISVFISLLLLLAFAPSRLFAQGSLTPPGAPSPTMKSLGQIEARTPISFAPYSIATSGSYYLTTNVTVNSGNAIDITANNVTLDLNGFTISSTQNPASTGKGIALGSGSGPVTNVTIFNGFITGGVTNSGSTFGGSGFGYGIFQFGTLPPVNVRVSNVTVSGCRYYGINLSTNDSAVKSCLVNTTATYGIYAQFVSDSTAQNCGSYGIYAQSVSRCMAVNCSSYGIYAQLVSDSTALNSGAYAIYARDTANNCSGVATGSGTGIFADIANNCHGSSQSGTGVNAVTANTCYGSSISGAGIYASGGVVTACLGRSSSSTGITALIANGSSGISATGTGVSATHNVNSYSN